MADRHAPILISGGGIGGLCAAIALAGQRLPVHVLEAAPEFAELGAGLQIGPNGARILAGWGLGEALARSAGRPERLLLKDGLSGRSLATLPLGDAIRARYGAPYLIMSRHALHDLLLEAVRETPGITLSCNYRVATCSVLGDHVRVTADGQPPLEARALVAADGVHSALRGQLFAGAVAMPSGKTALRALAARPAPREAEENAVCVWMAPDAHLVHYPIGTDGALNMVAVLRDADVPASLGAHPGSTEIARAFERWSPGALDLLAGATSWSRWPLLVMPPLTRWSQGPVTLLGDAAHPVLPFLASGAVMAMEDAAVLAQEVARTPQDCPAAFARYESRRRPRLAQLQAAVARTGEIYHLSGAMRAARNLSLALLPERALLARNDWLYGFRV